MKKSTEIRLCLLVFCFVQTRATLPHCHSASNSYSNLFVFFDSYPTSLEDLGGVETVQPVMGSFSIASSLPRGS